jgi:hypothetical protein
LILSVCFISISLPVDELQGVEPASFQAIPAGGTPVGIFHHNRSSRFAEGCLQDAAGALFEATPTSPALLLADTNNAQPPPLPLPQAKPDPQQEGHTQTHVYDVHLLCRLKVFPEVILYLCRQMKAKNN